MWPRHFRHWTKKVAEFTAGRTPQSDEVFLVGCELPTDPDATRCALAVRKVFAEEGSVDSTFIFATDRFPEDLGILPFWDSIDRIDVALHLEKELGVKILHYNLPQQFTVREYTHALISTVRDSQQSLK
jgi:acyl carrier protein